MAEKEKEIKKKAQDTEDISFEAGLSRLDEIIRILESDKAPLDTLMKLYEEGIELLRRCNAQLENAEQKVKILKISPDGTLAHLESFDDCNEGDEEKVKPKKSSSRSKKSEEGQE